MVSPLYTAENCKPAWQLRWSLALFGKWELPASDQWLDSLKSVVEPDGVRILEQSRRHGHVLMFLLSTMPFVAPPAIVRSVKGRLQHLLRERFPDAFRRNFSLTSVGEARADVVENYVATQLQHHLVADPRTEELLHKYRFCDAAASVIEPDLSSHGRYVYGLHLVLVHAERWRNVDESLLKSRYEMIPAAAKKKEQHIARFSLLPDHVHLVLRGNYRESPQDIALAYLNNLAFAQGMQRVFDFGYYVGTIGSYDMQAVRRALKQQVVRSTDTGSAETGH
jgi:REP element-mobilizing transposase RayT